MDGLRSAAVLLFLALCAHRVVIKADDVCQQPAQPGDCRAHIPRYFYNSRSGACEQFIYGGCDGNDNRFRTKEACQTRCSRSAGDVCQLPAEPGRCFAYILAYFYNTRTGACEQFIYGGCGGNGNKFHTQEACQARCSRSTRRGNVCQQPAQPGDCKGYNPSYFYNSRSGACEQFIYGGCGGNDNRFRTKEACQAKCSRNRNVCQQPVQPGDCRGYFPSYFYNSRSGTCEKFIYGGCGGNDNRFQTFQECRTACA